jgi:hypothetical protein
MAASVTTSGTAIASGIGGGRGSLVRIGVEGGRSARLSAADLQINGLFGPKIENSTNRSFPISSRPGAETVKLINKFVADAIKIPRTPEVKSNILHFPEVSPAKSIEKTGKNPSRGEIIFFPQVRPAEVRPIPRVAPAPIEYQRLATRVRTARLMAIRQARVTSVPEASAVSQPRFETIVRSQTATEQKVSTLTQRQPQPIKREESLAGIQKVTALNQEGRIRKVVEISAVDKDHKTNRDRVIALEAAFDILQAESGEDSVDGDRLGDRAAIEEERFKSEYFSQVKTPRRIDHSQRRTRNHLKEKPVKKSDIPLIVELHTAIRKADKMPVDPPTEKQFTEVIVPPDQILDSQLDEQAYLRKEAVYQEPNRITENYSVPNQAARENEAIPQELISNDIVVFPQLNPLIESGLMFFLTRLDSKVDNDIAVTEREELFKVA